MRSYISDLRNNYNVRLLSTVATTGLQGDPSDQNRIYSYDQAHNRKQGLCFFYFDKPEQQLALPDSPDKPHDPMWLLQLAEMGGNADSSYFDRLQQRSPDGLWSLSLERDLPNDNSADQFEWQERLQHNIVFIFRQPSSMQGIDGISMAAAHKGMLTSEKIEPQQIQFILYPEAIKAQINQAFASNFKLEQLISVKNKLYNVKANAGDADIFRNAHNEPLMVADYANSIEELIAKKQLNYPFCLHIMRLAVNRDFLKLSNLLPQLNIEQLTARYQAETPDPNITPGTLLRRAAKFGTREDVEFILQYFMAEQLNVDEPSPKSKKTALQFAISRKNDETAIAVIKSLLHYGAGRQADRAISPVLLAEATKQGYDLNAILSGEYDRQIFIQRIKASMTPEMQAMTQSTLSSLATLNPSHIGIGHHYKPPQTVSYHPPKRGWLLSKAASAATIPKQAAAAVTE